MLETVRQYMANLPDVSFSDKFHAYVLYMHDVSASTEVEQLFRNNTLNINIIDKIIQKEVEGIQL